MTYVPILFPSLSYGPSGDVQIVSSAAVQATLPATYNAVPPATVILPPVAAVPPPASGLTVIAHPTGKYTLPTASAAIVVARLTRQRVDPQSGQQN